MKNLIRSLPILSTCRQEFPPDGSPAYDTINPSQTYNFSMKKIIPFLPILFTLFLIVSPDATIIAQSYKLLERTEIHSKLGVQFPNALKLFDIAVDDWRGIAYNSPIMTKEYPMIDLNESKQVGTVHAPYTDAYNLAWLSVNPVNGLLYTYLAEAQSPDMYAIDPPSAQVAGQYHFLSPPAGMCVDTKRNRLFVGEGPLIRVLNGWTLEPLDSVAVGFPVGGLAIDSATQKLYVSAKNIDAAKNEKIKIYDISSGKLVSAGQMQVFSTVPLGKMFVDPARDRIILLGVDSAKIVRLSNGAILRSLAFIGSNASCYSRNQQRLFLTDENGYAAEGQHGEYGKLWIYDLLTDKIDSIKLGLKPSRMGLDDRRNRLVFAMQHQTTIDLYDTQTLTMVQSVDVGESVEDIAPSPDGKLLYLSDRLGEGNMITIYNLQTKTAHQMLTGNWSVAVAVDPTLERLFILQHYESSVHVVSTKTGATEKTITLSGVKEARTDALSNFHLSTATQKLIVCIPEYETVAAINTQTLAVEKIWKVEGYHWTENDKAVGHVQAVIAHDANRLFVLRMKDKKVNVYNLSTYAFIDSLNLTSKWSSKMSDFANSLMTYDSEQKKVYIGPIVIDPVTNTIAPQTLPSGVRWFGYNPAKTVMYSLGIENNSVTVFEHDPANRQVKATRALYPFVFGSPVFYHEASRNELIIAEFQFATLRRYDLNTLATAIETTPPSRAAKQVMLHQNYPNPFTASIEPTTIRFNIPEAGWTDLRLCDTYGRAVAVLFHDFADAGEHIVRFEGKGIPGGLYFTMLQWGKTVAIRSMVVME